METWLWNQAKKAATEANAIQMREPFAAVYLYHRRGGLACFAGTAPEGWELSDGRRIGPTGTVEENTARIAAMARRMPCLPEEVETA